MACAQWLLPRARVCLPSACQCACVTSLALLEYTKSGVSKCARCTWCHVSETAGRVPCGAQRMGLRDVGVVEGWVRLSLPHPDEVAAAEVARRAALRARTPKRTTPRVEENDRGRDTGALDPLDLAMASPSGKGFPDAELYDEMMPGTMVRAPPVCVGPYDVYEGPNVGHR